MTAPAPVIVQPDAEAWVWLNLRHIPGVTCFQYAAGQLDPPWVYSVSVQVDARAPRRMSGGKAAARSRAETARQVICALPDQEWPGGVLAAVTAVDGPFWLPDDDGTARYCARYDLRVHPRRDSGALHGREEPPS